MKSVNLVQPGANLSVLCLGSHADDIEIGAGGTLLSWAASGAVLDVHWCVFSASGERADEARASAEAFLAGVAHSTVALGAFRDSYFPYEGAAVKEWMEAQKPRMPKPDIVLTHRADDAHQDHRLVSELTWNAFRDSLILEYEIPKWDGDVGRPNVYIPMAPEILTRKIELLEQFFGTQRSKDWFDAETFRSLARLRGIESRARYAEAFVARKLILKVEG
ncbi:MAG: PIG-L deacetylase family protein [Alphaproteobacteria bacterium]